MPKGWAADAEPYVPLQWYYRDSAWKVCVVCQLLGMTSRRVVGPIVDGLFDRWGSPSKMAGANKERLREYLKRLGMTERRPKLLMAMSREWYEKWGDNERAALSRQQIILLPGCGNYAADSVCLFAWGARPPSPPSDRILLDWLAGHTDENGLYSLPSDVPAGVA